jgi:hypothetical protein
MLPAAKTQHTAAMQMQTNLPLIMSFFALCREPVNFVFLVLFVFLLVVVVVTVV